MNNRIAINMIKSYSCSTQTPNNNSSGLKLILKVDVEVACDHIDLGTISDTHRHLVLSKSSSNP